MNLRNSARLKKKQNRMSLIKYANFINNANLKISRDETARRVLNHLEFRRKADFPRSRLFLTWQLSPLGLRESSVRPSSKRLLGCSLCRCVAGSKVCERSSQSFYSSSRRKQIMLSQQKT